MLKKIIKVFKENKLEGFKSVPTYTSIVIFLSFCNMKVICLN